MKTKVPIISGSDDAFSTPSEAEAWINDPSNPITYPGKSSIFKCSCHADY